MPNDEDKKEPVVPTTVPPVDPGTDDDEDDSEILALKGTVEAKIAAKKENGDDVKETYSRSEVNDLLKKFEQKWSKTREQDDEDFVDLLDPDAVKRKFVRLPRLNNKFVVSLKNINKDAYIDEPIYFVQVEHPQKKGQMVPWATFIYDDGTEELYPYLSFMNRAAGVWGEVIEEKKEDISEKFGLVDVKSIDGEDEWNMKNTGKKVLAKALKYRTTYICKEIKTGRTLNFTEDVINKVEAPYSELKKFLEIKS